MLDSATTDRVICAGCSGVEVVRTFVLKLLNKGVVVVFVLKTYDLLSNS